MKTLTISALIILIAAFSTSAQPPKTEFTLELPAKEVTLAPGETKDMTINIQRSKAYSKSKAVLGLSSSLPDGLTLTFEPASGVINSSTVKIAASESAKPGAYSLLLNCSLNNKSKAIMLNVKIEGSSAAVTKAEQ